MKITRCMLCFSLLIAVAWCENSTLESSVSNSRVYYQETILNSLKQLISSVSSNKYHIEALTAQVVTDNSRLSNLLDMLLKADVPQITEAKIDELTDQIVSNTESIQTLQSSVANNQKLTEEKLDQHTESILDSNSQLSSSIDGLVTKVDTNQQTIEGKFVDVNANIDAAEMSCSSSIEGLEDLVSNNQKITEEKLDHQTDIILAECSGLMSSMESLSAKIDTNQKTIEGSFADLEASTVDIKLSLLKRIDELETTLSQKLETIGVRLNGVESTLNTIATYTRETNEILVISSCKTPVASGVFRLQFPNIKVLCETEFMDGGWLVIQQRVDITTSFNRGWIEYRNGFGAVGKNEDFWLGLESIHRITTSGQYELAVEFKDKSNKYGYARYSDFQVAGEDNKYKLMLSGHSGKLADCLTFSNRLNFSTSDMDNDRPKDCGYSRKNGGWWSLDCVPCNLNDKEPNWFGKGIYSRMMIRRK